jgi:hypothetical protein
LELLSEIFNEGDIKIISKMATIDEFALKNIVFDEGTESADIATNENILLLDEYSRVKLF